MTNTYDALMDHLATLAVEAVQHPKPAVSAYWLMLASHREDRDTPLTLEHLYIHAPDWARPYAFQALQHILQHGPWCEPVTSRPADQLHSDGFAVSLTPRTWPWTPAYRPYLDDVHDYTGRIWQAACHLYSPPLQATPRLPEEVLRGAVLFDAGLYFACHEYFETLWGRTADEASDFYQGLIQVAVAMRHLESHNVRGAIILLRYGMGRLQRYPDVYKALHVAAVLHQLARLLAQLEALSEPMDYQFDPQQVPRLVRPWAGGA